MLGPEIECIPRAHPTNRLLGELVTMAGPVETPDITGLPSHEQRSPNQATLGSPHGERSNDPYSTLLASYNAAEVSPYSRRRPERLFLFL